VGDKIHAQDLPSQFAGFGPSIDALRQILEERKRKILETYETRRVQQTARKSYEDWHETVQKMVDRGAIGTDEQFAEIMDYLFRTQTLIDVNSADVQDLQIVLNTSAAVAGAVVARRTRKKFTSLHDLKSVGGIDAAALDAKADLLVFR